MEIELNVSRVPARPPAPAIQRGSEPISAQDESKFKGAEALAQALAQLPDPRPGVVDKARVVVSTVKYPPDEIINRIATLLAIHLSHPAD